MDPNALVLHGTAVISTLDGVTTVLVAFLFVCLVFPNIVKNRPQYYAALAAIIVMLALHTLTLMGNGSNGFIVLMGVFTGFLQIIALILFVLCVGGLSVGELAGDMAKMYEVIRRGETHKEVIIPLGKQQPRDGDEPQRKAYHVDTPPAQPRHDPDEDQSIPLT